MYYFASDIHLGAKGQGMTSQQQAREVELRFVEWLKSVGEDAEGVFLMGDIFDFWFEYDYVVPKGFVRVLAELARLTDRGVRVVFMAGNHDMWVGNYLSAECGVEIYTSPRVFNISGRDVHIAHGDNLNIGADTKLRLMNKVFHSQSVRSLFSTFVHPNLALRFGLWWSGLSRKQHTVDEHRNTIDGIGVGALIEYAAHHQKQKPCDLYLYGHLHQTLRHSATDSTGRAYEVLFINDWSETPHYITIDKNGNAEIKEL